MIKVNKKTIEKFGLLNQKYIIINILDEASCDAIAKKYRK